MSVRNYQQALVRQPPAPGASAQEITQWLQQVADEINALALPWQRPRVDRLQQINTPPPTTVAVVTHFGAVGDGTADDTAAIQAAISSTSEGGVIFFPPGDYRVSSVTILNKSLSLVGVPPHPYADSPRRGGTVIRSNTHGRDTIAYSATTINTSLSAHYHLTIKNIGLYGNGPTSGQTGHGLYIRCDITDPDAFLYVTLDRVGVRRANSHGVFIGGGAVVHGSNLWADRCGYNGLRFSRRTLAIEASGSDASSIGGESYFEHVNVFNCGSLGTAADTRAGVYYAPGGLSSHAINRLSSSGNSGSGIIAARAHVHGTAWHFESNGTDQGTEPSVMLGDSVNSYRVSGNVIGSTVYHRTSGGTYGGAAYDFAVAENFSLLGSITFDSTSTSDIRIRSASSDVRVFGHKSNGTATGGEITDQGTRTLALTANSLYVSGATLRLARQSAPAGTDSGNTGDVTFGNASGTTYLYYCQSKDSWLRVALAPY